MPSGETLHLTCASLLARTLAAARRSAARSTQRGGSFSIDKRDDARVRSPDRPRPSSASRAGDRATLKRRDLPMTRAPITLLLLTASIPLLAHAEDHTILGNQLSVKAGATPDKRKIVVKAKETGSPDTIVGNPVADGATLTVSANGGTSTSQIFNLPIGTSTTGKPFWSGDATKGYKYKDAKGEKGPVKTAQIKKTPNGVFQIKAVIDAKHGAVSVVPPNTGTFGCAQLTIGGGDSYHIRFASGIVTNKAAAQFKVKKPTLEGSCTPCDFLDTSECLFPFPSDYFTVADASTDSGRRVHFTNGSMPRNTAGAVIESSDYNLND